MDSHNLFDDVELPYLNTLVTGKAKTTIAEFAYSGAMYKDALMKREKKFSQQQIVVRAYLDKLNNTPLVKMHNSDNIISFASMISIIVGVFQSLSYSAALESAPFFDKGTEKLPPNMKKSWSLHADKHILHAPFK